VTPRRCANGRGCQVVVSLAGSNLQCARISLSLSLSLVRVKIISLERGLKLHERVARAAVTIHKIASCRKHVLLFLRFLRAGLALGQPAPVFGLFVPPPFPPTRTSRDNRGRRRARGSIGIEITRERGIDSASTNRRDVGCCANPESRARRDES